MQLVEFKLKIFCSVVQIIIHKVGHVQYFLGHKIDFTEYEKQ